MKRLYLSEWRIENSEYGTFPAAVPGDISLDLYANGIIPDPFYADNILKYRSHLRKEFIYSTELFVASSDLESGKIKLIFEGIDTFSEIYLNGTLLGKTENMFLAYEFSCKEFLREGKNELKVKMFSVYDRISEDESLKALFHGNGIRVRKARCHFGWDWAPDYPGYGIYKPVSLVFCGGIEIDDVSVCAGTDGAVTFITEWSGADLEEGAASGFFIEAEISGTDGEKICFSRKELFRKKDVTNLFIEAPRLWQPNGYGEAYLYNYRIKLLKDERIVSERKGRFGIRSAELIERPLTEKKLGFELKVNGKDIFARGSNWVPISNLSGGVKEEDYRRLIRYAKEAGYNMLRVWGGGIYEPDIFYELCDEAGIMVMQDFMFSCSDVPDSDPSFLESVKREATYQLLRLRKHPCITVWCGGNEHCGKNTFLFCVLLRGLVGDYAEKAIYLYNSPCSRSDVEWDPDTGDYHGSCFERALAENDFANFRKYIIGHRTQFVSECTMLGPSRLRSLKKFIPEDKLWPLNGLYELHFVKNPYSPIKNKSFVDFEYIMGESLFGKIEGLTDFLKKGMLAQAELIKAEAEYARFNPDCHGFMNWMYNDNWGCGTWSVIDYYYERKPAYYYQKRAYKQVLCAFCEIDGEIKAYVRNDSAEEVSGVFTVCGGTYEKGLSSAVVQKDITLAAGNVVCFPIEKPKDCSVEFLYGKFRFGEKETDNVWHLAFRPDRIWKTELETEIRGSESADGVYETEITLRAKAFARAVFLDTPDNGGIIYEDNFFDIPMGGIKTVKIISDRRLSKDDIFIGTIADEWKD